VPGVVRVPNIGHPEHVSVESTYWNHNTAFHSEIVRRCSSTAGPILDVGCGDGLLVERLSQSGRQVLGLEPDASTAEHARRRCSALTNVTIVSATWERALLDAGSFGFISMVATLHHLDISQALRRAADLLAPGGVLYVIGIARLTSRTDYAHALVSMPRARVVGVLRREKWPVDMNTKGPEMGYSQVRREAVAVLPGARVRRRPYYRFSVDWRKPAAARA